MKYPILSYISHHRQFYSLIYEEVASELKLTQLEIDILLFLINNPEFNTARDIVNLRGFAKSNVSTAIEALQRQEYLTVLADPDNRRIHRLTLRPQKQAVFDRLITLQRDSFSRMLQGFTPDEIEQLHRFMGRMDQNMLQYIQNK